MAFVSSLNVSDLVGPLSNATSGRCRVKTGARKECDLQLADDAVRQLESMVRSEFPQLGSKALRFASLMNASSTSSGTSQDFHVDSHDASRVNAFVYLSDVPDASHGPLELSGYGPILGPRGTATVYPATMLHRGVANVADQERLAVAMAFSDSDAKIDTIGLLVQGTFGTSAWVWTILLSLVWVFLVVRSPTNI